METAPDTIVAASFLVPADAERAIGALLDHGVPAGRISVASAGREPEDEGEDELLPGEDARQTPRYARHDGFVMVQTDDPPTPGDMNAATEARRGGASALSHPDSPIAAQGERGLTTTTAADAAAGAARGSVLGIGVGLLAGAAALTVPGVGLVLAAGPLWTALAGLVGATVAGTAAGGLTGYLVDQGMPAALAAEHAAAFHRGSVLVTAHLGPHDSATAVADLFAKYGGRPV
jgi:hypothetical protein